MKSWVKQRAAQVRCMGEKSAPWYCYWRDPEGRWKSKSCGVGAAGKRAAKELAEKLHLQLATGTYELAGNGKPLKELCEEFLARCRARNNRATTLVSAERTLKLFRSFLGDDRPVGRIGARQVDEYVAARLAAKRKGWKSVAPATVNKELRTIKALLRMAADRGDIAKAPKIEMLRVDEKAATFISPEQFMALLSSVSIATRPVVRNVTPADWWRGVLVFAYFTGWRISQILAVTRKDVDLASGRVLTQAEHNKGQRDQSIALHPVVVEAIRPLLASFEKRLFPWPGHPRTLWPQFHEIQKAAGLPRGGKNGNEFGFHDLRRGFATANAARLTAFQLQHLMQHRSIATTQKYVAMGSPVLDAVDRLAVPPGLSESLGTR